MSTSPVTPEIFGTNDPELDHVEQECLVLVEKGLLHLGFDEMVGFYFWPTFRGLVELDMLPTEGLPH